MKNVAVEPRTIILREQRWYAVYTQSRHEKKVAERFQEQGIHFFLPQHKILKLWSDRKRWVEEPLFKSYIFVKVGLRKYEQVLHTEGVITFVKFNGFPEPINNEVINSLIKVLRSENEFEVSDEKYDIDEKVKVVKGALKGVVGQVAEIHGKHKIIIHIEVLGRNIVVNVNKNQLEKLQR